MTVTASASASGTINARHLLEQVCEANNLGTHRPAACLISINSDKTMLWLPPVVTSALPVTYDRYGFRVNLYKPFRLLFAGGGAWGLWLEPPQRGRHNR